MRTLKDSKLLSSCAVGILCFCLILFCSCSPHVTPSQQIIKIDVSHEPADASPEAHEAANSAIERYDGKKASYTQHYFEERGYRTNVGNAQKTTVLIYLCAGSLESLYGSATQDIIEIEQASDTDKMNVVMQTGGTSSWQNDTMADNETQRWFFDESGIHLAEDRGRECMTDEKTFADFVSWGVSTYPADRYCVVLWDHGGGSMGGFGVDEVYPDASMLSLDGIARGLLSSNVSFDIVGFDACLMSTVENAWALEPVADYLVAAEVDEPERGWDYTRWLSAVANNPHLPSTTLCGTICDSYKADTSAVYAEISTSLCAWDLTKLPQFAHALDEVSAQACLELERDPSLVRKAREAASLSVYSEYHYEMIDLEQFATTLDLSGELSKSLRESMREIIAASSSTTDMRVLGGAGIYLEGGPAMPEDAIVPQDSHELYSAIGFSRNWAAFADQYATLSAA